MAMNADKAREIDDNQILEWISCWRTEGLTPLMAITGYAELLLKNVGGDLSDEQRRFVQIILRSSRKAQDWFRQPADYLAFRLGRRHVHWQEIHLPNLIAQVFSDAQIDHVEVDLADNLPSIRGNQWLQTAFFHLIEPDLDLARIDARPAIVKASLVETSSVLIQVYTRVQLGSENNGQHSFFPGTRLSVADQVIRLCDSQIQAHSSDKGTEFRFTLPVWQMPPDTPRLIELTTSNDGDQVDLMQGQDLVVHLANVLDSLSWRITGLDSQVLTKTGSSWKIGESDLELRFWTFKIGHTPLRIEYDQVDSPKTGVFSVQIRVRPQAR